MKKTLNINLITGALKSLFRSRRTPLERDLGRFFILICLFTNTAFSQNDANQICGKWMSSENDLKVEVYQQNGQYKAKVIWFACLPGEEMKNFYDTENPTVSLRTRPWLGLQVLQNLQFKGNGEWGDGQIYDPNTGHTFSSVCRLEGKNALDVRGYWMYQWIGKSMKFYRTDEGFSKK